MRNRRPVLRRGRLYFVRSRDNLSIGIQAEPGAHRVRLVASVTSLRAFEARGRFILLAPVTISLPLVDRSIALRILRNLKREALCERS